MTFLRRLFCRHQRGRLVAIEWDGATVHECTKCGKHIETPLAKQGTKVSPEPMYWLGVVAATLFWASFWWSLR